MRIGSDLCHPEPAGGPTQVISDFLPLLEVVGVFDLTHKYYELKRERNFPAALRSHKPHVITGKEFSDNTVMEEIPLLFCLLGFVWFAHISDLDSFQIMVKVSHPQLAFARFNLSSSRPRSATAATRCPIFGCSGLRSALRPKCSSASSQTGPTEAIRTWLKAWRRG